MLDSFAAEFIVVIVAIGFSPSIQNGFLLPRSRLQKHWKTKTNNL